MKKLLAFIIAFTLVFSAMPALAATQATITVQTDPEAITAVLGAAVAEQLTAYDGLSVVIVETDRGMVYTISRDGSFVYDLAIELDGPSLYIGSSLLDRPLYVDLLTLAEGWEPAGMVLLTDWQGLMNGLSSLSWDFSGTLAAISAFDVSEDGMTVTADTEQLCAVVDALAADVLATDGLADVLYDYLDMDDLPAMVNEAAANAKAWIRANITGSLRIKNMGTGLSITLPVGSSVYGASFALNASGINLLFVNVNAGGAGQGISITLKGDDITLDVLNISGSRYTSVLTVLSSGSALTVSSGERVLITETVVTEEVEFSGELVAGKENAADFLNMDAVEALMLLVNANTRLQELMQAR